MFTGKLRITSDQEEQFEIDLHSVNTVSCGCAKKRLFETLRRQRGDSENEEEEMSSVICPQAERKRSAVFRAQTSKSTQTFHLVKMSNPTPPFREHEIGRTFLRRGSHKTLCAAQFS